MVAVKQIPATLVFWLVATRRWRALVWFGAVLAGLSALTIIGAGPANALAYLDVLRTPMVPKPLTLAALTGIPWWIAVMAGAVAVLLSARHDARAFRIAVVLTIVGSPFIGVASTVAILPLGAAAALRSSRVAEDADPATPGGRLRRRGLRVVLGHQHLDDVLRYPSRPGNDPSTSITS